MVEDLQLHSSTGCLPDQGSHFPWYFSDFSLIQCRSWANTMHYSYSILITMQAYLSKSYPIWAKKCAVISWGRKKTSTQFWKGLIMWKYFSFSNLALSKPIEKYFENYLRWLFQSQENLITMYFSATTKIVYLNTQKRLLYITLSSLPYAFKPKTENKNIIYNTCLNVTSCIKVKNGKQIRNARLYDRNREKCKNSLQAQKKSTNKIKILYVSFQQNL